MYQAAMYAPRALLLAMVAVAPVSAVDAAEPPRERTVSVSGHGERAARPDAGAVELGVEAQASSAAGAIEEINRRMRGVLNAMRSAGVKDEDVRTSGLSLEPRYEPEREGGAVRLVGYVARNTVELRVRDLTGLGSLLDAAVKAGGNRIHNIRFEISEPARLLDAARADAMRDARHKAEQLAKAAGAEVAAVLSISESSGPQPPRPFFDGSAARLESVPVASGTETVAVDVQVTWLLR